jgi:hypothetical protein
LRRLGWWWLLIAIAAFFALLTVASCGLQPS